MELYDDELDEEVYRIGVHTLPLLASRRHGARGVPSPSSKRSLRGWWRSGTIRPHARRRALDRVRLPSARTTRSHPKMSVLHFDAHGDLRDEYEGNKNSHACAAHRWVELGIPSVHVGIRSISKEEVDYVRKTGTLIVSNREMHRSDAWMEKALAKLTGEVYVTFDVDFFDGSLVPGTGTPEPGGGTYDQALAILRRVGSERRTHRRRRRGAYAPLRQPGAGLPRRQALLQAAGLRPFPRKGAETRVLSRYLTTRVKSLRL